MKAPLKHLLAWLAFTLAWAPVSALATPYTVAIRYFTEGAVLTIGFDGTDIDGDGLINGSYPTICNCVVNEITSLSFSFSGNSVLSPFSASTTDFSDPGQSLFFDLAFGDFFDLIYVIDQNGSGAASLNIPGLRNGDLAVDLAGVMQNTNSVSITGSPCGSAFPSPFPDLAFCAVLAVDNFNAIDFAVPEPGSIPLLSGAIAMLALRHRRIKVNSASRPLDNY